MWGGGVDVESGNMAMFAFISNKVVGHDIYCWFNSVIRIFFYQIAHFASKLLIISVQLKVTIAVGE